MTPDRLSFATEAGGLTLPEGRIAFLGAPGDAGLAGVDPACASVIQTFHPDFAAWEQRGVAVTTAPEGTFAGAVVSLARARELSESRIAQACAAASGGLIVVDGAKTDGVESIARALRARVPLLGQVSKSHGKVLWFTATDAFADWARVPVQTAEGDWTAPGVFSATGADPASRALAEALPPLKGAVADLGAGWGWLSREILRHDGVTALHMVEAEKAALDCAQRNVSDPRAAMHWQDVTVWTPPAPLDAVVMNPPFHTGRKAEPALGRAFIAAAARMLSPRGALWMVANRHLPYETALSEQFREHAEVGGNTRFKILHATHPLRGAKAARVRGGRA